MNNLNTKKRTPALSVERLKEAVKHRHTSYADVEKALGFKRGYLSSMFCNGRNFEYCTMCDIADLLDVELHSIMYGSEKVVYREEIVPESPIVGEARELLKTLAMHTGKNPSQLVIEYLKPVLESIEDDVRFNQFVSKFSMLEGESLMRAIYQEYVK